MSKIWSSNSKTQGLWNHSLRDRSFISILEHSYHTLFISNYGPNSSLSLIRNSAQSDFVTSSSKLFLQQLSFFHPCFKFINALINSQVKAFGTHGLFVGALCSGLLFRLLKLEDLVCHIIVRDVSEWVQDSLFSELQKVSQNLSFNVDIGELSQILMIVRGIIFSKPHKEITEQEMEAISLKTVEAFLKIIPEPEFNRLGKVNVLPMCGPSALDSQVVSGVLHRDNDIVESDIFQKLKSKSLMKIKIIIFTVPLSVDVDEKQLIYWHKRASFNHSFIDHLQMILIRVLKQNNINVVANQKFIDATLKYELEKAGFIVLDRLGTVTANALLNMTGCCPVANLCDIEFISKQHVGNISTIDTIDIGGKSYLNIVPEECHENVTFVLAGPNTHTIEHLKESVETSISLLQMIMRDPSVAVGGGCLESQIVQILLELKENNAHRLTEIYGASIVEINMVFDVFIEAFLRIAVIPSGGKSKKPLDFYIDSTFCHVWEASVDHDESKCDDVHSMTSFSMVRYRCVCGCVSQNDLPLSTQFSAGTITEISRQFKSSRQLNLEPLEIREIIKNRIKACFIDKDNILKFQFRVCKHYLLDYLPAKLSAIHLALDGLSELYRTGVCIFDK